MPTCLTPPDVKSRSRLFLWRKLRQEEIDHELIWLSTSVGSAMVGYVWIRTGRPLPPCVFHAVTGVPCPTCGATRATMKLLAGDLPAAFAFNPLLIVTYGAVILFNIYAAIILAARLPRLRIGDLPPGAGRAIRWSVIAILLINWAWLIYSGV